MKFNPHIWTSRKRVLATINHKEPDRVPIDLGGTVASGINVVSLHLLHQRLGLKEKIVKVCDVFQMLGEVEMDMIEKLHIDVLPVEPPALFFGIKREKYKSWKLFDGTPVLVPGDLNVKADEEGNLLLPDQGDIRKPIVAKMPKDGYYFDDLRVLKSNGELKHPSLDKLREEFLLTDEELEFMSKRATFYRKETDKALIAGVYLKTGLGFIGSFPDFLMLISLDKGFLKEFLYKKHEIIMENLRFLWRALGENIEIIALEALDFGGQNNELISPDDFQELYLPYYKEQYDWIHENTTWKTFQHCCGSITNLLPLLVDAGLDIINPVQTSAYGMNPKWLKEKFGDKIAFWGGGIDTQKTLPFGTPIQIKREVEKKIKIFAPDGGFVFCPEHNIQYGVPVNNIIAAYETAYACGKYPIILDSDSRTH